MEKSGKTTKPLKVNRLWSRSFASAVDKITIEKYRIDGQVLMELAGKAIADHLIEDLDLKKYIIREDEVEMDGSLEVMQILELTKDTK